MVTTTTRVERLETKRLGKIALNDNLPLMTDGRELGTRRMLSAAATLFFWAKPWTVVVMWCTTSRALYYLLLPQTDLETNISWAP